MIKFLPPLAIAALVLSAAPAFALQAAVEAPLYGTRGGSDQVGTMPQGAEWPGTCDGQFCFVDNPNGPDGWTPATNIVLGTSGGTNNMPPAPSGNSGAGGFNFDFGLDFGGGNNNPPPRPPRPRDGEVCFFDRANFRGESVCVGEGDYSDRLPRSWNDRISSISVDRGLAVEVCRDRDLEGSCQTYTRDVSRLPSRLDDRISSFEVTD